MNKAILMGRLARDPESKFTNTGKHVATFTVAVDRRGAKKEGTPSADFIPCIAWDKTADVVCNYFTKGRMIAVEGHIQVRQYDAKDGSKRTATEIICENIEFCGDKSEGMAKPQQTTAQTNAQVWGGTAATVSDDEVPF